MFRFSARWLAAPSAVALVAVVVFTNPNRGAATGAADWEPAERTAEYAALEAEQALVGQRIALKNELVTQLIDGRVTLEFVTAEFQRLNAASPVMLAVLRDQYAGATDEEKTARNVIEYTRHRFAPMTDDGRAVLARLQAEFDARFGAAAP
jgi:hypothetical protein